MSQIIKSNARDLHQIERLGAVFHGDDAMTGIAQRLTGQQLDIGLVVDQEDIETVRRRRRIVLCPKLRGCSYCSYSATRFQ